MLNKHNTPKKSNIWNYFTNIFENSTIKCNICSQQYTNQNSSTSNLIYHLKQKHEAEYRIAFPNIEEKKQQEMMETIFKKASAEQQERFNNCLTRMVAYDSLPFQFVEGQGFKIFMNSYLPQYNIPTRQIISSKLLEVHYSEAKKYLINKFCKEKIYGYCITSDLWTSINNKSFITITFHYLNNDFQLQNYVLSTHEFQEEHSGDNIKEEIEQVLCEFNIYQIKYKFSSTDSGANMQKAFFLATEFKNIPCFCHSIHNILITISIFSTQEEKDNVIFQSIKIASYFRYSPKRNNDLVNKCVEKGITPLKTKLGVKTRWNSYYDMISRLIYLKEAIISLTSEKQHKKLAEICFTYDQWQILDQISEFLKPFYIITQQLSTCNYPTASSILPIINTIKTKHIVTKEQDCEWIIKLKNNLLSKFTDTINKNYFLKAGTMEVLQIASYIDPKFKSLNFIQQEQKLIVVNKVKEILLELKEIYSHELETEKEFEDLSINFNKKLLLEQIYGQQSIENLQQSDLQQDLIQLEMQNYEKEPVLQLDQNSFYWWQQNKKKYKLLHILAQIYLSISASSVPSERVFSKAGKIISKQRSNIKSELANYQIFLSQNLQYINIKK